MKPSAYYDRVVDVVEELVKFTLLTRGPAAYLTSRYSERKEAVEKLVALGARRGESLQALADQCEVIVLVVVDDKQVNQVVGELLRHPGKLHTIIVSSTVLPSTVVAQLKRCLLDSIGCGIYGALQPWGRIAAEVLAASGK